MKPLYEELCAVLEELGIAVTEERRAEMKEAYERAKYQYRRAVLSPEHDDDY